MAILFAIDPIKLTQPDRTIFKIKITEKLVGLINKYIIYGLILLTALSPYFMIDRKMGEIHTTMSPIYEVTLAKNNLLIGCAVSIGSTTTNIVYWDINKKEALIVPKKWIEKIRILMPEPPQRGYKEPPSSPFGLSDYDKAVIKWDKKLLDLCGKNRSLEATG